MQHPVTLRYLLWSGDLNGISVLMNWTHGQDPGASCYNRDTGRIRVSKVSEKGAGHSPLLGPTDPWGACLPSTDRCRQMAPRSHVPFFNDREDETGAAEHTPAGQAGEQTPRG